MYASFATQHPRLWPQKMMPSLSRRMSGLLEISPSSEYTKPVIRKTLFLEFAHSASYPNECIRTLAKLGSLESQF